VGTISNGGHIEIQDGGHCGYYRHVNCHGTIWLAGPQNLGITTWIMFVSVVEPKLWYKTSFWARLVMAAILKSKMPATVGTTVMSTVL
jgi:hypothetical protein